MRRRSARPLSRAARLTKEWLPFQTEDPVSFKPTSGLLGTGQFVSSWVLTPDDAQGLFDEPTVLRTLVQVACAWNQVAAQDLVVVSYGMRVATDLAQNASEASSLNRGDFDWIWVRQRIIQGTPGTAVSTGADSQFGMPYGYDDVRTKRRIEAGEGLIFCIVNEDTHLAGASIMYWANGRILYGH